MKATDVKVKNFTSSSYGVFENGKFVSAHVDWQGMIDQATLITNEGVSTCTIATLKFAGTDEEPTVEEGVVIMKFRKIEDTVYITNQLG